MKTARATVKDYDNKPVTVKVGDYVGFKSDVEQYGKIKKISGLLSVVHSSYSKTRTVSTVITSVVKRLPSNSQKTAGSTKSDINQKERNTT